MNTNDKILEALSEGLTIKEIACRLFLSKTAIEKRLLKLRRANLAKNNIELVLKCTSLRNALA